MMLSGWAEGETMIDAAHQQLMKHARRLAMDGHGELAQYLRDAIEEARAPQGDCGETCARATLCYACSKELGGLTRGDILRTEAITERCKLSTDCLPQAPYRLMLEALHADMLAELERTAGTALTPEQEPVGYVAARDLARIKDFDIRLYANRFDDAVPLYAAPKCEAAEQREAGLVGCPLTETLTWHPADEPPDADLLVLLGFRGDGWEAGYWDSEQYRDDENAVVTEVTHWAHPKGPL
jgi:hypothetical protein